MMRKPLGRYVRHALAAGGLLVAITLPGREITIAVFDSAPPVVFVDDTGRPAGIFPDILEYLLEKAGHEPVFVSGLTFAEAYQRVAAGDIDLLPGAVYTEARDAELDFNQEPVLVSWGQVGIRPGGELNSIMDLRDARVGIMQGGQNGANFITTMEAFDIPFEPVYFDSFEQITDAIAGGDVRAGIYFNSWFRNSSRVVPSSVIFAPTQAYVATREGSNADVLGQIDELLREIKQDEESYYFEVLGKWLSPGGTASVPRWIWISGTAVTGALLVFLVFILILRQKISDATVSLAESRERYRTVARYAHGWEFWMAPNGEFVYVSPNARAVTGYEASALEADASLADRIVLEEDRETWRTIGEHARRPIRREQTGTQFRIRRADGEIRWIEHRGTSVFSDDGEFRGYRGTNIDVTERMIQQKRLETALHERSMMLKEIHHRVKNNLQTIASLVSIQQHSMTPEAAQHLDAISARVHAMGALHGALYREDRFGEVELRDYAQAILHHIHGTMGRGRSITTSVHITDVRVQLERALPIGLLINESLTNAYKHAFSDGELGTIEVRITRINDSSVRLSISDSGKGIADAEAVERAQSNGIGLSLIESLASQLGGTLHVDGSAGTTISVEFSLA